MTVCVCVELHDVYLYCANMITDNFKAWFSSINKFDFMITICFKTCLNTNYESAALCSGVWFWSVLIQALWCNLVFHILSSMTTASLHHCISWTLTHQGQGWYTYASMPDAASIDLMEVQQWSGILMRNFLLLVLQPLEDELKPHPLLPRPLVRCNIVNCLSLPHLVSSYQVTVVA